MLSCCSDGRVDEAAQRHAERQHPRPRQFRRVPLHRGSTEHVHRADVPCADQWGAAFHHTQPRHLRGTHRGAQGFPLVLYGYKAQINLITVR